MRTISICPTTGLVITMSKTSSTKAARHKNLALKLTGKKSKKENKK